MREAFEPKSDSSDYYEPSTNDDNSDVLHDTPPTMASPKTQPDVSKQRNEKVKLAVRAEMTKYIVRIRDNVDNLAAAGTLPWSGVYPRWFEQFGITRNKWYVQKLYNKGRDAYVTEHDGYPEDINEYYRLKNAGSIKPYGSTSPLPTASNGKQDERMEGLLDDGPMEDEIETAKVYLRIRVIGTNRGEKASVYIPITDILPYSVTISKWLLRPRLSCMSLKLTEVSRTAICRYLLCISPTPLRSLPISDVGLEDGNDQVVITLLQWSFNDLVDVLDVAFKLGLHHIWDIVLDQWRAQVYRSGLHIVAVHPKGNHGEAIPALDTLNSPPSEPGVLVISPDSMVRAWKKLSKHEAFRTFWLDLLTWKRDEGFRMLENTFKYECDLYKEL